MNPVAIDLSNAADPILAALLAAARLDRANLERAREHLGDVADDDTLRDRLEDEARDLSLALAALPPGLRVALTKRAGGGGMFYEVVSATTGMVTGVTTDPLAVLAEQPDATFNRIRLARYQSYANAPWTEPTPDVGRTA